MHIVKHHPTLSALVSASLILPLIFFVYLTLEPKVAVGQTEAEFTITQQIGETISIVVAATTTAMSGTIDGLTGGVSSGSNSFTVATNALNGYQVTIQFDDAVAMVNASSSSFAIQNLTSREFDFSTSTVSGSSGFAYTVTGGDHVDGFFADDGDDCGTGSNYSAENCWFMGVNATDPLTIVDSNDPTTGAGDETNLYFRVLVDANPNPAIPPGTYNATATLTATVK